MLFWALTKVKKERVSGPYEISNSYDAQEEFYEKIKTKCEQHDLSLYGIINNAAVQKTGPLDSLRLDDWDETISVNLIPNVASKNF